VNLPARIAGRVGFEQGVLNIDIGNAALAATHIDLCIGQHANGKTDETIHGSPFGAVAAPQTHPPALKAALKP
jgi:hypothetical protein